MPQLMPDTLADLVNLTLSKYEKTKWVDISLNYRNYICASRLFTKKKMKMAGGTDYKWKLQVRNTGNARHTQLFDIDQTGIKDLSTQASVPYAMQTVNWSYDVNEEEFQTSMEQIVDVIKMRRHAAYNDYYELMEDDLWSSPTSSSQSPRVPFGIPFWLQKNATTGFNGGNPSGFTDGPANVNATTYPNWKNYTFGYQEVDRNDLIAKMKKACEFTNFKAPHTFSEMGAGPQKFELFTTYSVIERFEQFVESRNDNLGKDLAQVDGGEIVVKRAPIICVSYLDANDLTNPVYGVNWDTFFPIGKKGTGKDALNWHKPTQSPHQHTVRDVHGDAWCQYVCINRRANWVTYDTTVSA